MKYRVAERFKSIQGEGLFAGTPMAFIRLVGCSVGKTVCNHCDTDFDKPMPWRGGGEFTAEELVTWAGNYQRICLTGGEPLNQDIRPLLRETGDSYVVHLETSGTVDFQPTGNMYVCVSPKPGYLNGMIVRADEIKIIVPGLGNGEGWPTLDDAKVWALMGKPVFLQPRNGKFDIDKTNLMYVMDLLRDYPQFRLSYQAHKLLKVQ